MDVEDAATAAASCMKSLIPLPPGLERIGQWSSSHCGKADGVAAGMHAWPILVTAKAVKDSNVFVHEPDQN